MPAAEIPGYVYDKATNRYFKVPKAGQTRAHAAAVAGTSASSSDVQTDSLSRIFQRNSTETSGEGLETSSKWDPGRGLMAILHARELRGPASRHAAVPRLTTSRRDRLGDAVGDAAVGGSMVKELLIGNKGYARSWISHSQPSVIGGLEEGAACQMSPWAGNIGTRQKSSDVRIPRERRKKRGRRRDEGRGDAHPERKGGRSFPGKELHAGEAGILDGTRGRIAEVGRGEKEEEEEQGVAMSQRESLFFEGEMAEHAARHRAEVRCDDAVSCHVEFISRCYPKTTGTLGSH